MKRGQSLQKQKMKKLETQQLELEAKQLEDQLIILKTVVSKQRCEVPVQRWKAATPTAKIKNYAQNVLEQKRRNDPPPPKRKYPSATAKDFALQKPPSRPLSSQQSGRQRLAPIAQSPVVQDVLNTTSSSFQQQRIKIPLSKLRKLPVVVKVPLVKHVFETQTESLNMRTCCWQCYKTTDIDTFQTHYQRLFCSFDCFSAFKETNVVECKVCWTELCKGEGVLASGEWLCSVKCQNTYVIQNIEFQPSVNDCSSYVEDEGEDEEDQPKPEEVFNEFLTKSLVGSENVPPKLTDLERKYKQL